MSAYPKPCYCREITYDLPENRREWALLAIQPWVWPAALTWCLLVAVIHAAHRLGVRMNWHKDMVPNSPPVRHWPGEA